MAELRILVCGSRTFNDQAIVFAVLNGVAATTKKKIVVIQGEARGADTWGKIWAEDRGIRIMSFPADWDTHGKRAGYLRNVQMLEEGKPGLVFAFVDKPLVKSKGTAMMVDIARKAGLKVYVVERIHDG